MVLGIENQVKVCGYSFCDAIDQWYPYYSVMTPVFLDLSGSVKALNVSVQDGTSVSIDGRDLGEVLQQCWKQHVPFVCIRISKSNVDVLRSYEAGLRVFQEDTSFSASVPLNHCIDCRSRTLLLFHLYKSWTRVRLSILATTSCLRS